MIHVKTGLARLRGGHNNTLRCVFSDVFDIKLY